MDVNRFQLLQWKFAVKLEEKGMKHSSGRLVKAHAARVLGIPGRPTHAGVLAAIIAALNGCVAMPDTVRPELTHMSHVTQHSPISHDADYHFGSNTVGVILHWDTPLHAFIELGEAISLDKRFDHDGNAYSYGEIMGPREQFIARIGYTLHIDKTR